MFKFELQSPILRGVNPTGRESYGESILRGVNPTGSRSYGVHLNFQLRFPIDQSSLLLTIAIESYG
ncbi:hypothetical protein E4U55_003153 [Claviceps digitariae]|nr:hypothetical protein E4U55_003153 [Claviceps digitariae]